MAWLATVGILNSFCAGMTVVSSTLSRPRTSNTVPLLSATVNVIVTCSQRPRLRAPQDVARTGQFYLT
jgi:hypothetical protein